MRGTRAAAARTVGAVLVGAATVLATAGPAAADPGPPGPADGLRQTVECTPTGPGGPGAAPPPSPPPAGLATGAGQLVAVIDTGVAPLPRLAGRVRGGGDYLTGGDGLTDCDGHGTGVALILAGAADPVTGGGAGIAPATELLSLRQSSTRFVVDDTDGAERPAGEIATLASAIERAVALGASVINVSQVVCVPAEVADDAGSVLHAAVTEAVAADVLLVAAAGNTDPSGTCTGAPGLRPLPASYDEVLAVGAVDALDEPAGFSIAGPWVDVAAPGVDLPAPAGPEGSVVSGTSYAAPVVAGTAALLRERFPMLTADQVAGRILATARRPAAGRDDRVGSGVVDPAAALTAEPLLLAPRHRGGPAGTARVPLPVAAPQPPELPAAAGVGAVAAAGGALALALTAVRRRPAHRGGVPAPGWPAASAGDVGRVAGVRQVQRSGPRQ
ncbi:MULTISPECIES: type VII secretion-associated serine protease mycosin [Pseudonocardia]|uniref:Thermophilic serine proteinase n=2 Tax=Pseudonocardia TaxID=1847 RepID=A0A1Y2N1F6_PSEAH|nr:MULTISPECIES: type VII secretion-associated serine protease mycosin [Pseudonocardia]OSY41019.1 Thermophilic serine proteinase precursor [Pseudonocardia autotrophica]TDN73854.1 membrane-anchored mycosin MYCP [Pseudonocardia autotrophica]BBG04603.1 mycosin-4 [Pseudonocardia autotrophica]GEC25695.1 mycosin-4 [Pseudonocardia saturnea]